MSSSEDETVAILLAGYCVRLEEENRKKHRKVLQRLKRIDVEQGAEKRPSTLSSATSGSERCSSVPSPILGCNTEQSITSFQKKRKISDATESSSCNTSRTETPTRESTPTGSETTAVVSALNKISSKSTSKDDYDLFGDFVSWRLRKLGKDYSQEVEHEIVNIIFAAERRKKHDS